MKNLTKGMDYMDENVERGIFDRQNKVKMLCNWIEHIDLMEWGFSDVDWINDRDRRREFGLKLCQTLELNGGFNSDGHCWVSMCSFETKNDGLILMFDKRGSAIGECFSLTFELR
jgi:negative regulator of genetic competence, sporulation and motility